MIYLANLIALEAAYQLAFSESFRLLGRGEWLLSAELD